VTVPLRPYQQEAFNAIAGSWLGGAPSCLVELPTGTGKTRLAAEAIGDVLADGKRALFIAHRLNLVKQGAKEIGRFLGRQVGVWSGEEQSALHAPILSASKDTLHHRNLSELDASQFGLLVIDEAHHCSKANQSYGRVIAWAKDAGLKIVGITATPDRSDKAGIVGDDKPFQVLAYRYPIWNPSGGASAIDDGWLVPIRQEHVHVDGLDFSAIKDKKNWTDDDIAAVLAKEELQLRLASATVQTAEQRSTVVFCPTVAFAYKMGELIDRYAGGSVSVVIHGQHADFPISKDDRHKRDRLFKTGERQFAVSVDALTEGWDAPRASCIVVMRPVKSRLRFAQMVGRGTRLLLDIPNETLLAMTPEQRREAIKQSKKTDCLVVGFQSNLRDLKLWVNVEDLLGDGLPPAVKERAKRIKEGSTTERLLKAKEQLEAEHSFAAWEREQRTALEVERMKLFTPRAMIRRNAVNVYGQGGSTSSAGGMRGIEEKQFRQAKNVAPDRRPSVSAARLAVALGLAPEHCMGMTGKAIGAWIGEAKAKGATCDWDRLSSLQLKYGISWFFSDAGRAKRDAPT
jgi:superfamily II DNA or RNA helicase